MFSYRCTPSNHCRLRPGVTSLFWSTAQSLPCYSPWQKYIKMIRNTSWVLKHFWMDVQPWIRTHTLIACPAKHLRCLPVPRVQVADRPQPLDQQHLLSPAESEICLLNSKQRRKGKKFVEKGKGKAEERGERQGKEDWGALIGLGREQGERDRSRSLFCNTFETQMYRPFATLLWDTVVPHCHTSGRHIWVTRVEHYRGTQDTQKHGEPRWLRLLAHTAMSNATC